jgi:hypothetical protein
MRVVKRLPVLKSNKVETDAKHDHKLWWIDIVKHVNGTYQLHSKAQIFSVNIRDRIIEGEEIRTYELDNVQTLDEAEFRANIRYAKKKSNYKGYSHFKNREKFETNLQEDIVNEFLKKYG